MSEQQCLFQCDQCTNEEWRPADQEPWLCVVCGWYRWGVIATSGDQGPTQDPSEGGTDGPDREVG